MAATSINCLAVVLKELDWSYSRLIAELRRRAAVDAIVLPKTESLIPLISRWVNNHQQPDDFYRELLSRATGRHRFELFSDEVSADQSPTAAEASADPARASAEPPPSGVPAPQPGAEVLTKRAQAERAYATLSADGAPVSAGQLAAAAGLSASYARALVAQFQTRPPAAVEQNGRRPTAVATNAHP